MSYSFNIPTQHKSIIKVIGVGGGGSNAVNHMFNKGIKDVEFVICNTDAQALNASQVPNKLQIGVSLTEGLGAGANPERGKEAALESREDIRELLSQNTKMIFVTAGMGGGTGTGAAPVIAQIAKDLEILTVGIVTAPFSFEGKKKINQAKEGIEEMRKFCDTVLVISNDKLREIYGSMTMTQAYAQADNVLTTAAKGIAEIITVEGYINVDFEDVKTVMKNSGTAVMGSAKAEGEGRARRCVEEALSSPLLNNKTIKGAKKVLLSIASGDKAEITMDEFNEITGFVQEMTGDDTEIIFGNSIDASLNECVRVTIIATGFDVEENIAQKKLYDLFSEKKIEEEVSNNLKDRTVELSPHVTQGELFVQEKLDFGDHIPVEKKVVFNLDDDEDTILNKLSQEDMDEEEHSSMLDLKKKKLLEQAEFRKQKLKQLSASFVENNEDELKEKLNVPAYMRKKIKLKNISLSSEKEVSRYNIDENNQILGKNKFFDDQPD